MTHCVVLSTNYTCGTVRAGILEPFWSVSVLRDVYTVTEEMSSTFIFPVMKRLITRTYIFHNSTDLMFSKITASASKMLYARPSEGSWEMDS